MITISQALILAAAIACVYGFCWFASWYNARHNKELRATNHLAGALEADLTEFVKSVNASGSRSSHG